MKIILVSQRLVGNTSYPEVREALDVEWGRFLSVCGFLPIPVAAHISADIYFKTLKPSGVLLTGGNDLAAFAPADELSKERDRVEKALIECALLNQVPVIGVCRGMQMLAHYYGCSIDKKPGHVVPTHEIFIQPGTLLQKIVSQPKLDVNSFHNYCVTRVQGGLKSAALHADGTVEAIEMKSQNIYGLMWHPERVQPYSNRDIQFFKEVF